MTTTQIAFLAIRGMRVSNRLHIDIMEMMRTLKLTTDEAVALRGLVRTEWLTTDQGAEAGDVLHLAKTVVNQYARDYRHR